MPMFNDIQWAKKDNTETCWHNAKEVTAFATQFKPGHWCFLGPASEKMWWNGHLNEPQRQWVNEIGKIISAQKEL